MADRTGWTYDAIDAMARGQFLSYLSGAKRGMSSREAREFLGA